jgi:DNA helicase-2/ATP-dependent DNA helicase PcrA
MEYTLRPSQSDILRYRGGRMGVSAVPGSGKTFTLSALAAQIITSSVLEPDQEVLIVTLVNSAVDNFAARIGKMIEERGLLPHLGYRVRTLHGLAHDIVRERPALAGLDERFQIVDEREADLIRKEAANAWLKANAHLLEDYFDPEMEDSKRDWVRRQHFPELVHSLALAFIRSAKDRRLDPDDLRRLLEQAAGPLPLVEMGLAIYADYQRALQYRGAVDFDDLIRLAYQVLETDPDYLARLQYRFPYILEDEAQDSSRIQEEILRLLAGHGNWVRVGDPNQAIFETFTTANPQLLKDFIAFEADARHELPVSGRSQPFIIEMANFLIDWTNQEHPAPECRDALTPPWIQPAGPDDPQPNPSADPRAVRVIRKKHAPEEEVEAVVKSLEKWLPEHPDRTVAVLVPRNARGVEVVEALKKRKIEYVELINSTNSTRMASGALGNILAYLSDPGSPVKLAKAYQVWRRAWREDEEQKGLYAGASELLRKIKKVEEYLFPADAPAGEAHIDAAKWLGGAFEAEPEEVLAELETFRTVVRRWQGTTLLPIDQMVLTLGQELFAEPADLALTHKLALVLKQAANDHNDWRLPQLTAELGLIARNERRFIGFSSDDSGFDPEAHRGKVVVSTIHKAKGLEWDRVYLMSVNNYDFPSLEPNDRYISEKWFLRGGFWRGSTFHQNLDAEALSQLDALCNGNEYSWYEEGKATLASRTDYVRERLRLLYVGITRAKSELILTWNTGRQGDAEPSLPFQALAGWLNEQRK